MLGAPFSLLIGCAFRRQHCLSHCLGDALCKEGETHCSVTRGRTAFALHAGVDQHESLHMRAALRVVRVVAQ